MKNTKPLENTPHNDLAKIETILGCKPVFDRPQITENCVYECSIVENYHGATIIYRYLTQELLNTPDADQWRILGHRIGGNFDFPKSNNAAFADEVKKFRQKKAVEKWRGDKTAAAYYNAEWNVQGLLQQNAIGWIYGAPGSYKTVMAMDMACSVATGGDWCGRKTRQGPVLYLSAEGGAGIYAVRDAWERNAQKKADQLAIYVGNPSISEMALREGYAEYGKTSPHPAISILKELKDYTGQHAALIVIDTFAQTCADDTKAAVTAYESKLRKIIANEAPGASVLVIDHTTKEGSTWMGSNAKLGNMDMMAMVKKSSEDVLLSMRAGRGKVKNAPPFNDVRMRPRLVDLGIEGPYQENLSAPVLDYCAKTFTDRESLLLSIVGDGAEYGEIRAAWHASEKFKAASDTAKKTALSRALRGLRDKDTIEVQGLEYDATSEGPKERPLKDDCIILPL